jgi:cytochrome c-type biogenesis protein CcmF
MSVLFSLCAAALSALLYFRLASSRAGSLARPRRLLYLSVLAVAVAAVLLLTLLLRHDFSNGYVYSYSDRALPLEFLVSSFYAGQEGSFLFWALCAAAIALVLSASTRRRGNEPAVMAVYMTVQTVLFAFVLVKSPFRSVWEMFPQAPAGVPLDGRGLNPLLQNFWMVIHPPVLFLGFAAMAVPFSLAVAGLWKRTYDILPSQGFPWVLGGATVLGLGIMLGAYWAYGVLGWGGYWGWDPVENSSLVPWLTGVALLHTMLAQLRTGKYVRTNLVLALVSFFLVIYSTFLTRSGILGDASVHAFTDPGAGVYWLLLGSLGAIAAVSAGLMIARRADLRPQAGDARFITRESSLGAGTIMLLLSAAVVTFGTTLPIFSSLRVEPSFYDATNLPLAIAMGLLIGYSLYTQWEMQDGPATFRRSRVALLASLLGVAGLAFLGVRDAGALALIFTSLFALCVNVDIGVRVARGDPRFLGGKLAHAGVAVFFLGMIASGRFESRAHVALPLNHPREVLGHVLTYTGFAPTPDGKFAFSVRVEGKEDSFTMTPVMFAGGDQGIMRNPAIASFFSRDFYLSPVGLEAAQAATEGEMRGAGQPSGTEFRTAQAAPAQPERLVVEASIKPYMSLLWGGMILMIMGFALAIVKRTQEARWKA